ncbi:acylphosphatase-2-like isoform X1 [Branchiostoma floridae x Branchiostoma belcheri]
MSYKYVCGFRHAALSAHGSDGVPGAVRGTTVCRHAEPGVCRVRGTRQRAGCVFPGEEQASRLGLVGWVRNTRRGTVEGVVQGKRELVQQMKHWLEHTGSPMSRISRATFRNQKDISKLEFDKFKITF